MAQDGKTFTDNTAALFQELKLAVQWKRPSILLAVCRSKPTQAKAEAALTDMLKQLSCKVIKIEVNAQSPRIAQQILDAKGSERTIFYISNLDWGGGQDGKDAYRSLNMSREIFVENSIKAIFWLTPGEATNLPHYASDFWAFRHRMVEFSTARSAERIPLTAGLLIWHGQKAYEPQKQVGERIETYQRFLNDLPDKPESLSTRLELLYTLGYLYWILGNTSKAVSLLRSGLDQTQGLGSFNSKSWLASGLAIIAFEQGDLQQAAAIYESLLPEFPKDSILYLNYGAALCALGKNSNALSQAEKAARLNPNDGETWNRIGYLYIGAGKPDQAVECFKKAVELAPAVAYFYISLALCYSMLDLPDEALRQIGQAYLHTTDQAFLFRTYEAALQGRPEHSSELLKRALSTGKIARIDILRDFNSQVFLHDVLDPELINR